MNFLRNLYHWIASIWHTHGSETPAPNPAPVTPPPVMTLPEPGIPGQTIDLTGDQYCTEEELSRIPLILAAIYKGLFSPKYKEFLLNPDNGLDLNQINGLTAEQFVEVTRTTHVTAVITFYMARFSSVIGYRNVGKNIIHCNRKFHDSYTPEWEAANVFHESVHIMGFDHDFNATARRPYSGPYMANAALEYALGLT